MKERRVKRNKLYTKFWHTILLRTFFTTFWSSYGWRFFTLVFLHTFFWLSCASSFVFFFLFTSIPLFYYLRLSIQSKKKIPLISCKNPNRLSTSTFTYFHWKFTQLMFESGLHCAYVKMSLFVCLRKSKEERKKHSSHSVSNWLVEYLNVVWATLILYFISGIYLFIYFDAFLYFIFLSFLFFFCGDLTFTIAFSHELQSYMYKKYEGKKSAHILRINL